MAAPKRAPAVVRRRTVAELVAELEQRTAERDEALAREAAAASERDESEAQKAAIAEVLGVINASPGNLTPVFDAMLEKALRLCGAAYGSLLSYDGEFFRVAAAVHYDRHAEEQELGRGSVPSGSG